MAMPLRSFLTVAFSTWMLTTFRCDAILSPDRITLEIMAALKLSAEPVHYYMPPSDFNFGLGESTTYRPQNNGECKNKVAGPIRYGCFRYEIERPYELNQAYLSVPIIGEIEHHHFRVIVFLHDVYNGNKVIVTTMESTKTGRREFPIRVTDAIRQIMDATDDEFIHFYFEVRFTYNNGETTTGLQYKPSLKLKTHENRAPGPCDEHSACCLKSFYVNFTSVGWKGVVSPKGFHYIYCDGVCKEESMPEIYKDFPTNLTNPTCVGTSYDPLEFIYMLSPNEVHVTTLEYMQATSCSCWEPVRIAPHVSGDSEEEEEE